MSIPLQPKPPKLLEEQMNGGEFSTRGDMVIAASETPDQCDPDKIDDATLAAINRAEAQYERGEGIPADEAFAQLRRKHFGN